jgi:DNA-binding MarR family transcriptional regulator
VAFLLARLGSHATERFAQRVQALGLTPPQISMLQVIAAGPGQSQQSLARRLGVQPSRVVALIDGLERRDLVERTRNRSDRRLYAVTLTAAGREVMTAIAAIAAEHEQELCVGLSAADRRHLRDLLDRIAEHHALAAQPPPYRDQPDELSDH